MAAPANDRKDMAEYDAYIKELYKVIDKLESKSPKPDSFLEEPQEEEEQGADDEEDQDQNEEQLEKYQPQIVLDQSAMVDRNDDPNFAEEEEKDEEEETKDQKYLKDDEMYDEILSELKNEPVEILPEIVDEPLNLADYNIEMPKMPSEQE